MNVGAYKPNPKYDGSWQPWFAWRPIQMNWKDGWAWLEQLERSYGVVEYINSPFSSYGWRYRFPEALPTSQSPKLATDNDAKSKAEGGEDGN